MQLIPLLFAFPYLFLAVVDIPINLYAYFSANNLCTYIFFMFLNPPPPFKDFIEFIYDFNLSNSKNNLHLIRL